MTAGLYEIGAGGVDRQGPHERDEIYAVLAGRAVLVVGETRRQVKPGDVIYVRRDVEHRFEKITSDLSVLVIFAPGG